MSLLKANAVQLGQSLTATNNFTWYQPSTPDGTVRLGNGNSGSVTDLVTLTSAGNLGIGTSSPSAKLDVIGNSRIAYAASGNVYATVASGSSSIQLYTDGSTNGVYASGAAIPLTFSTNGSERMRLDSSGNLGLGVTPSAWRTDVSFKALQLPGGSFTAYMAGGVDQTPGIAANGYVDSGGTWRYINSRAASWYIQNGGMHAWYTAPSGTAGNAISFTQAMTLDASGNLLVGRTNNNPGYTCKTVIDAGDTVTGPIEALGTYRSVTSTIGHIGFFNPNGRVGEIYTSASTTTYSTSSDQRLKTNVTPAGSAIQSILDFPVDQFDWIVDGSHQDFGAVAQKAINVIPEMVSVPEDSDEMWGIDWSKAVPRLIKTIQELSAELNELKQKVNA